MRFAPAACSRRQIAAPTRLAPPVISTTLPCTRRSGYTPLKTGQSSTSMFPAPPDPRSSPGLPELSLEEQAHASRVLAHVKRMIARQGGWTSFADYMSAVLYAPGLGYYAAGAHKLGAGGDFVTAPELTPLFGKALATQLAQVIRQLKRAELI